MTSVSSWREAVKTFKLPENLGEWLVSYKFWLGVAVMRLPTMDQRLLANHDNFWQEKLPILLICYLASGLPLYIASITVLRNRFEKQPSPIVGIIVWLLSDLAVSVTAVWLLGENNLRNARIANPIFMLGHALGSIPTGATMLFAVCLFFSGRRRTRELRESVAQQQELVASAEAYRQEIRASFQEQISANLLPGFERIKSEVQLLTATRQIKGKFAQFAKRVNEFSITDVRGLSHKIATSELAPPETPTNSVRAVITRSRLSASVLRPANPYLAAWLFLGFAILVNPDTPIWVDAIEAVVIWLATDVCSRLHQIFVHAPLSKRILILLVSIIAPVTLASVTDVALMSSSNLSSVVTFSSSILVMASILSYPYRFHGEVGDSLQKIKAQNAAALLRIRIDADEIRDSFSRFLHGQVQGRLALVSFILGQIANGEVKGAAKTKQVKRLIELLDNIEDELRNLEIQQAPESLQTITNRLTEEWFGLVEISAHFDSVAKQWLQNRPDIEAQVSGLIEEAVLNARVHGHAEQIEISIKLNDDRSPKLWVEVIDNGKGLKADQSPGLGSRHFSAICETWSVERIEGEKTKFSALVAEAAA